MAKLVSPWAATFEAVASAAVLPLLPSGPVLLKLKPGLSGALMTFSVVSVTIPLAVLVCVVEVVDWIVSTSDRSNSSESCRPSSTPEFVGVVEPHFGDQHLDHHHRRPLVELLDNLLDFVVVAGRRAERSGCCWRSPAR